MKKSLKLYVKMYIKVFVLIYFQCLNLNIFFIFDIKFDYFEVRIDYLIHEFIYIF